MGPLGFFLFLCKNLAVLVPVPGLCLLFSWLEPELLSCFLVHRGSTGGVIHLLQISNAGVWHSGISSRRAAYYCICESSFIFIIFIIIYLFVLDDSLTS